MSETKGVAKRSLFCFILVFIKLYQAKGEERSNKQCFVWLNIHLFTDSKENKYVLQNLGQEIIPFLVRVLNFGLKAQSYGHFPNR